MDTKIVAVNLSSVNAITVDGEVQTISWTVLTPGKVKTQSKALVSAEFTKVFSCAREMDRYQSRNSRTSLEVDRSIRTRQCVVPRHPKWTAFGEDR